MNLKRVEIETTKAMGLIYLAQAISDFDVFPIMINEENNQIMLLTVHGVNAKNWKFIIHEIYYEIEEIISGGIQREWKKKAAMMASLDYEGSRTSNFNESLLVHPHVHAIIILPSPTSISTENLSCFLKARQGDIKDKAKYAMYKKGISDTDHLDSQLWRFSVCVDPFVKKQNVCLASAISYQIKATSFLNSENPVSPVVLPFDLKIHKLTGRQFKINREKEKAHILRQDLIFDPHRYFSGGLFENHMNHDFFLTQYRKLKNYPEDALMKIKDKAIHHIENKNYEALAKMALTIKMHILDTTKRGK